MQTINQEEQVERGGKSQGVDIQSNSMIPNAMQIVYQFRAFSHECKPTRDRHYFSPLPVTFSGKPYLLAFQVQNTGKLCECVSINHPL